MRIRKDIGRESLNPKIRGIACLHKCRDNEEEEEQEETKESRCTRVDTVRLHRFI